MLTKQGIVFCAKNLTQHYSKMLLEKSSENGFIFFTCILPDYMTHGIQKEFWKNSHFEKNKCWFPSKVSKLTSAKYP